MNIFPNMHSGQVRNPYGAWMLLSEVYTKIVSLHSIQCLQKCTFTSFMQKKNVELDNFT